MNERSSNFFQRLRKESFEEIESIGSSEELIKMKKKYLGKEGIISHYFQQITSLIDQEKKKQLGQLVNNWKNELNQKIEEVRKKFIQKEQNQKLLAEKIDITSTGKRLSPAYLHPLTQFTQKITVFFQKLGYQLIESPEIESEENNFNKLNIPADHPARAMHDTFYFSSRYLLRTHTSGGQIRIMEKNPNQDLKIVIPGKVYRRDEDDATHTHQFTQIEGLVVGKNISLSHLKGTLVVLLKELFGSPCPLRFRPSYFPFTEPSCEVDIQCLRCQGKGCNICKQSGWIEVLGAGLVHPQVLKNCGYNSEVYSGFAFGMGVERLLMTKYGIEDIRNFYLNDIRFLKQFRWL